MKLLLIIHRLLTFFFSDMSFF